MCKTIRKISCPKQQEEEEKEEEEEEGAGRAGVGAGGEGEEEERGMGRRVERGKTQGKRHVFSVSEKQPCNILMFVETPSFS